MDRYRTEGRLDEVAVVDGDPGFTGVDERDPSQLPPGYVNSALNFEFRDGVARPRRGIIAVPWLNDGTSFTYLTPLASDALAGGVFSDPDDLEWVMIATPTTVYAVREGFDAIEVPLPDAVTMTEVSFCQAMDKLLMFRGDALPVLELSDVVTGFGAITQAANTISGIGTYNPADGTSEIPQASGGIFMQNRVLVPHGRDLVAASDYLNYTRYSATQADFRVNAGSADRLLAIYKFGESSVVAFKEQSIYQVDNVYGDMSLLRQQELTREFGLVARKAVVAVGDDVWFLSQRGVTSIGQIQDNKIKATKRTWTDPMVATMKRLNWQYAANATATYFDGKFYLAIPLDDAEVTNNAGTFSGVNNAIMIWDTANDAWSGIHTGAGVMVKEWLQFTWAGKKRLGFLANDGMVMMLDYTFNDWVRADGSGRTQAEVSHRLVSRGFTFTPTNSSPEERRAVASSMKRYRRATAVLNTWHPKYTIDALVDGVNETTRMADQETRDRTKWVRPFDRAPWVQSNVNNDHGDMGREDYSVNCSTSGGGGGTAIDLQTGINFEQHQEAPVVRRMNLSGRFCQIVVEGTQGRVELKALEIEGRAGSRRNGVLV